MLSVAERVAQVAEHIAAHDAHGYSQPGRAGDGTQERLRLTDGSEVAIHGGDYDCSEMARVCANCALSGAHGSPIPYMWTGNEDECLRAAGFERLPFSAGAAARGTILLRQGHTAVSLGGGRQAEALSDERGTAKGAARGDQAGREICVNPLSGSWQWVYRYSADKGEESSQGQDGDEMICIIQPDGKGYLEYFDGAKVHPLSHPDEVEALNMVYKATHDGASIPCFALGSKTAPWATRLHDALR